MGCHWKLYRNCERKTPPMNRLLKCSEWFYFLISSSVFFAFLFFTCSLALSLSLSFHRLVYRKRAQKPNKEIREKEKKNCYSRVLLLNDKIKSAFWRIFKSYSNCWVNLVRIHRLNSPFNINSQFFIQHSQTETLHCN